MQQQISDLVFPVLAAFIIGSVPICCKYIANEAVKAVNDRLTKFEQSVMVAVAKLELRVEFLETGGRPVPGRPLASPIGLEQQQGD